MKICTVCKKDKDDKDFSIKKERNGLERLCSWCKKCSSIKASERNKVKRLEDSESCRRIDRIRYWNNRDRTLVKNRKLRIKFKKMCVDYKGGKCAKCGYNKCLASLDFHHTDKGNKEFHITEKRRDWEKTKIELDKCILLCSNCHKELHYNTNLDAV